MLLDKSENLLELSVKQLVMESGLASKPYYPRSGYISYMKNKMLMLFVANSGIFVSNKSLIQV